MSSTPESPYHPDYEAFLRNRQAYNFRGGITDSVARRTNEILTQLRGGCWGAYEHPTTREKLMILFLEHVRKDFGSDIPLMIGTFKVVLGDDKHKPR